MKTKNAPFWIVLKTEHVINKIKSLNKKKNTDTIMTFHFSTFYTKFPHNKLLYMLIDFYLGGGGNAYVPEIIRF